MVVLEGGDGESGDAESLESWGYAAGALGRSHGLIERIGERIESDSIREIVLPAIDDEELSAAGDRLALIAAAVSAASVHDVIVRIGEEDPMDSGEAYRWLRHRLRTEGPGRGDSRTVTAVISAWNKYKDVRANLLGIRAQVRPFDDVVVVDNHSSDGTAQMIRADFPEVRLVVMPNSAYGACETFNVGFSTALTEYIAILDDDVVLTPWWLDRSLVRMGQEPETTAVVSTKVVEPGMPDSYRDSEAVNAERYMSTFRGCASLAKKKAIDEAGGYDERLFIYGNERDLTCRLLNLGYRVLQFSGAETWHRTPFGVQMGKRSLYFHARNAFLGMIKYAPLKDLVRLPFLAVTKVLFRGRESEESGTVTDAVGTIGIGKSVRETKGSWWILTKAAASVVYNLPYCLKRREPVKAPDFELPLQ
ncbi:glycosyltransferase family 2 protein [Planctomycetes bacterium Poly30]|uniref:glycosyltransferase family 2 protein n=1 Tax=Saltatorellus ferox TaxID=2528018 RepID=UPI0011AA584A